VPIRVSDTEQAPAGQLPLVAAPKPVPWTPQSYRFLSGRSPLHPYPPDPAESP